MTCSESQIWQHLEYISFWGRSFPGMRVLILVLMSNVCYLAVILIFWWLLGGYCSLPSGYCSLPGGYCSLLVVAGHYHSLLLVPTFSMNEEFFAFFSSVSYTCSYNLFVKISHKNVLFFTSTLTKTFVFY